MPGYSMLEHDTEAMRCPNVSCYPNTYAYKNTDPYSYTYTDTGRRNRDANPDTNSYADKNPDTGRRDIYANTYSNENAYADANQNWRQCDGDPYPDADTDTNENADTSRGCNGDPNQNTDTLFVAGGAGRTDTGGNRKCAGCSGGRERDAAVEHGSTGDTVRHPDR